MASGSAAFRLLSLNFNSKTAETIYRMVFMMVLKSVCKEHPVICPGCSYLNYTHASAVTQTRVEARTAHVSFVAAAKGLAVEVGERGR